MSRQVRRVAMFSFVLFAALFVNLNYLHVLQANQLSNDSRNARGLIREYEIERGSMIVGERSEATPIARSEDTGGRLRFARSYPEGPLWAPVTGYHSFLYGRAELERSFNDFLVGSAPEVFGRNLADLLAGRQRMGDTLRLTLDPAAQRAARDALGDQIGAVVAIQPSTGAVLALWSSPSYDPNLLASLDGNAVREAWSTYQDDPDNPLLNRAVRELYPPGSVFKLVTAAAALEAGHTPEDTFDDPVALELPQTTSTIGNFGGGVCNDGDSITLAEALRVSCNTTFAHLGLELGADALADQAERFGLNSEIDFHLSDVAVSRFERENLDEPATAQSAIGQRDVRVSPLQMAMITAAIANDGVVTAPRLVQHVEDFGGRILRQYPAEPLEFEGSPQAVSGETARALRAMMLDVVESGTGQSAAIDGVDVAGKTGTAQTGEGRAPTVWFTGFAPAGNPRVAVAVVVADGGEVGDEATGGAVAAPIARAVIQAVLRTD